MSVFKKSKETKENIEFLSNLLSSKVDKFTENEIRHAIITEGYTDKVARKVIKQFKENKLKFKSIDSKKTDVGVDKGKDKILKELSRSIQTQKKEAAKEQPNRKEIVKEKEQVTKNKPKKEMKEKPKNITKPKTTIKKKTNLFKKIGVLIALIYFFFENRYYDFIEWFSKVIPIDNLTDRIDKVLPSFLVFLAVIALVILALCGGFSGSKVWTVSVEVIDSSNNSLNEAVVTLELKGEIISTQKTDVFGETIFKDIKGKGLVTLNIEKEHYSNKIYEFMLNKNNLRQKISLDIQTDVLLLQGDLEEQIKNIYFVENSSVIVTDKLTVNFYCSNPGKTPMPSYKIVSSGKVLVNQPAGCGDLRVSVNSNEFQQISNQIIPENNKVQLTRLNTDTGQLSVKIKNLQGLAITDALIKIYAVDSPATQIDESQFAVDTGSSDIYGKYTFDINPGDYLINADKTSYLFIPKQGPYSVIKNTNTDAELMLFTAQDLQNIDCSNTLYDPFCVDGELDCENELLQPYLTQQGDTCILGNVGYLDVILKDSNTNEEVVADIALYYKPKDQNQVYTSTGQTTNNTSNTTFNVIDLYDYQVRLYNTEASGYINPEPYTVNSIDQNITIYLEYASELNSGTVGVNIKDYLENNINGAKVYLYREEGEEFILVNQTPKITNLNGDVNFILQRANKEYYAYSVHSYENLQGTSSTEELDVNDFLQLEVTLEDTPSILNLQTNVQEYDIQFYTPTFDEVTDYVVSDIGNYNKQYIFYNDNYQIFAILSKPNYTSYQTDLIILHPGQEVFKEVELNTLASCPEAGLELLGFYNETGEIEVEEIDFTNYTLDNTYKARFKFSSCSNNPDLTYAQIRTGEQQLIDNDYISIANYSILTEGIEEQFGYSFIGELEDWNSVYYNQYYEFDHTYTWSNNNYKWIEIDFTDMNIQEIEFSIDIQFSETIAPTSEYTINYRALSLSGDNFSFDPEFGGYENWTIVPNGYFYAPTNKFSIPFSNDDYILDWELLDSENQELELNGDGYTLIIDETYSYIIDFLYLDDNNKTGDFTNTSTKTNNNLIYNSYIYTDSYTTDTNIVNDTEFSIVDLDGNIGYHLIVDTNIQAIDFFDSSSTPEINTEIFKPFADNEVGVYAYYSDSEYLVSILTTDTSGSNNIYIGENIVDFKVLDNQAQPVEGVLIKYTLEDSTTYELGSTNSDGRLDNMDIAFGLELLNSEITFAFLFSANLGFENNEIELNKTVLSGYNVVVDNTPLTYLAQIINVDGINITEINTKEYTIKKYSDFNAMLDNITFNVEGTDSQYFDETATGELVTSDNNLNKLLFDNETIVTAPIVLKDNIYETTDAIADFKNILTIRIGDIIKEELLEVDTLINIDFGGSLSFSVLDKNYGVYTDSEDNLLHIELIKNVVPELTYSYMIYSDSNMVITSISATAGGLIDISALNTSLGEYTNEEISIDGVQIDIPIKLNSSTIDEEEVIFNFTVLVDETEYTFTKTIVVESLDKLISFEKMPTGNLIFTCEEESCLGEVGYRIVNHTKSYDGIEINKIEAENLSDITLQTNLSSFVPITIPANQTEIISFEVNGDYEELLELGFTYLNKKELELTFNQNISDLIFETSKELLVNISVIRDIPIISTEGISYNLCLGVGGQVDEKNIFIFANCEDDDYSDCKTGTSKVPKVIYSWDTPPNNDWKTACVSEEGSYNTTGKYYCDSTQMLMTLFQRLNNNQTESFYIYLVTDGVSEDLLKDLINDISFLGGLPDNVTDHEFFRLSKVGDEFTIIKNNTVPGMYKLTIDEEKFNNNNELHITLELETELLSSEKNIFYYIPIDGGLGTSDGNRKGYGAQVVYDTQGNNINFTENIDLDDDLVYENSPVIINASNYNQGINSPYLENILNSEGRLISMELHEGGDIPVIYLYYTVSKPVPVYARASCTNDINFNYNLKQIESSDTIPLPFNPFIKWKNITDIDNIIEIEDNYLTDSIGNYVKHYVSFNELEYALLRTMLFLPAEETIENYILNLNNVGNAEESYLYGLNDDLIATKELVLKTKELTSSNLTSIQGIFEYLKDASQKACIYKSQNSTYIKWIESEFDFTEEDIYTLNNTTNAVQQECGASGSGE